MKVHVVQRALECYIVEIKNAVMYILMMTVIIMLYDLNDILCLSLDHNNYVLSMFCATDCSWAATAVLSGPCKQFFLCFFFLIVSIELTAWTV